MTDVDIDPGPTAGPGSHVDAADDPSGPPPGSRALRWTALVVVAYLVIGLAWLGSNPPAAAPDEPHHLIKALGMANLEIGDEPDAPLPDGPPLVRRNASITRLVEVPSALSPQDYTCAAFRPRVTADCIPSGAPQRQASTVELATPLGAYPPFVYVPLGLAAEQASSPDGAFYIGRLVALAWSSAILAVGLWFLVRHLGRWSLLGAFLAMTPMAVFTAAMVTTSGLEITGAFTIGAVVTVCLVRPSVLTQPSTHVTVGVVGSILVLSRQMGIVTLALLLGILVAARWREVVAQIRVHQPSLVASAAVLAASSLAVLLWERAYDHPVDTGSPVNRAALPPFLEGFTDLVHGAVGNFGWLDTPLPWWAWVPWVAASVVLFAVALRVGDRRDRLVLAVAIAATIGITFASYSAVFHPVGSNSQGRHMLPLFVFSPTYAGVVVMRSRLADRTRAVRGAFVAVAAIVGLAQSISLVVNARRYAVGIDGPINFLGDAAWAPPGGWLLWLALGLVGAGMLATSVLRSTPRIAAHKSAGEP